MKIGQPPQRHHVDWQLQLINIVFLLLLFFVITGTISNLQDATITLPETSERSPGGTVAEAAYIDADGKLSFRGAPSSVADIAAEWFKEDSIGRQVMPFQIIADRRLPATKLVDHLQKFRQAGFRNLTLVTVRGFADAP